jgi:hypothetical protein
MGAIVNKSVNGDGERRLRPLEETSPDEVREVVVGGGRGTHFRAFSDVIFVGAVVGVSRS